MILVDTSVWIDRLRDCETPQTIAFGQFLTDSYDVGLGDLIMMEVLQGTRDRRHHERVMAQLTAFTRVQISDHAIAAEAARNYQHLRGRGLTVRKTIYVLIATRCIVDDIPLLYSDRDFDPFVRHLGLRSALDAASGVN